MTQDEIIEMAKQAHRKLVTEVYFGHMAPLDPWTVELLQIFAKLVAAKEREHLLKVWDNAVKAEREACAVIAEEWFCGCGRGRCPEGDLRAQDIANSIRARGEA